jgi:RND family efflux transporter MFP subunit
MESARATLEQQEYNLDKARQLFAAKKISQIEMLTTQAQHGQAKAIAESAEIRYRRAAIKAPFAGIVADRFVEPGELVGPGTPVARVIDPYTLKIVGSLTEREVGWLQRGAAAEVRLDGSDRAVAGVVHWIGFEADPSSGKFKVEIQLDNPDLTMRSGVVGRARILKKDHGEVLAIPRDCVLSGGGEEYVYVVEGDSAAVRPVTLGIDQGLMVVVTGGLAAGERVVVRGQRDLVRGAKVKVTEAVSAPDGSGAADPAVVKASAAQPRDWGKAGE